MIVFLSICASSTGDEGVEGERGRDRSINISPERLTIEAQMDIFTMKEAAACQLPAGLASQCFLFSARNDRSSLCKRQKGQSLIDMCKNHTQMLSDH